MARKPGYLAFFNWLLGWPELFHLIYSAGNGTSPLSSWQRNSRPIGGYTLGNIFPSLLLGMMESGPFSIFLQVSFTGPLPPMIFVSAKAE